MPPADGFKPVFNRSSVLCVDTTVRGRRRRKTAVSMRAQLAAGVGAGSLALTIGAQSTIFTIGWVDRVRYSSSSCSRLVAVTVTVIPR